jgi:ABC-type iron transport system FetAB ATPase subunit
MVARLAEFKIGGLFGLYDHRIAFNLDERITIIIGPNGRGKTVCLKFIEAFFRKRFSFFAEIPFRNAEFIFTNGSRIKVERSDEEGIPALDAKSVSLTLSGPAIVPLSWTPRVLDVRARRELRRFVPDHWEQINPSTWIDNTDGEELSIEELGERFRLPPKLLTSLQQDIPEEFSELLRNIDCHLIETQRLLVLSSPSDEPVEFNYGVRRRRPPSGLAIQEKAQKLRTILKNTFERYASLSNNLDRSFPLRVFEAQGSASLSQDQLREELKSLDGRRDALMKAGILDADDKSVTIRGGNIDPGVVMALEIYVRDASKKLDVFNNLRSRLDLFKELIEKRFIDKTIHIDRESGFRIVSHTTADVPLEKLSSGEQHQLILVFDLLFEVTENSLILIDEPELSLHVTWQKTIIESLQRIIALNAFDVLLATHSPAVVARHFNLSVELGPVDE